MGWGRVSSGDVERGEERVKEEEKNDNKRC